MDHSLLLIEHDGPMILDICVTAAMKEQGYLCPMRSYFVNLRFQQMLFGCSPRAIAEGRGNVILESLPALTRAAVVHFFRDHRPVGFAVLVDQAAEQGIFRL
jgi:hypothetical protein